MEVSNELGNGFLEAVYQEALGIEFDQKQIPYTPQQRITISYRNITLKKEYMQIMYVSNELLVRSRPSSPSPGLRNHNYSTI
jgi:GxxExxY protein